ncbi:MAG TPA: multicopper oxidase domain-containing protein, partial [Candidatus Limnocylindrales bacterium]|nr:multicopper oxidase domain-containing protein [Candidatus Limnocylindrales bacterium]
MEGVTMFRQHVQPVLALVAALTLGGCAANASASSWSFDTAPGPAATAPTGGTADAGQSSGDVLAIEAGDTGFTPSSLTVPAAGTYAVAFRNAASSTHDLTFSDGTTLTADAGGTATGTVDVPANGLSFKCTIPGTASTMAGAVAVATTAAGSTGDSSGSGMDMNMNGSGGAPTGATGGSTGGSTTAAAPVADPNAPAPVRYDPRAPKALSGTVHDIEFPIIAKDITVAKGFVVHAWTFGGTVPGPAIRVHVGDTVRVHLTNTDTMPHSIDFHASQTAMNDQMVEIAPGATFTYTFTPEYAGVWMYHCGTAPTLLHIANGMFGMVIVEPKDGLPKVDAEYAFVQSEWYLGAQGQPADYVKASAAAPSPDFVVFNGVANQYKDEPIQVPTGKRIRLFVLDAGPNVDSSFHVVGT